MLLSSFIDVAQTQTYTTLHALLSRIYILFYIINASKFLT